MYFLRVGISTTGYKTSLLFLSCSGETQQKITFKKMKITVGNLWHLRSVVHNIKHKIYLY